VERERTNEQQISGAFGTIKEHDTGDRRGLRARLLTLLAIIGPGLIVMIGDNDAGGVSTYAQAGQNFGYTLLWTLPLLIPVLHHHSRDGRAPWRRHGRGLRPSHSRTTRTLLGQPVDLLDPFSQFPHHHHRVHRRRVLHAVLRCEQVRGGAGGNLAAVRRHGIGFFQAMGAIHDALRRDQPARRAAVDCHQASLHDRRPSLRGARYQWGSDVHGGAADHFDNRHDDRTVAALFSRVQHCRQENFTALAQLRASRYDSGLVRGGDWRLGVGCHLRCGLVASRRHHVVHERARRRPGPGSPRGSWSRSLVCARAAERLDHRRHLCHPGELLRDQ
jgi:hypothetical protein